MNDIMKTVKSQATKLATAVASNEMNVWPPVCFGIYFQPERPVIEINEVQTEII